MAKKDEILEVAKKYFSQYGYEGTSLDLVAKEVGVTKPALYYHFKNKKEIYNEIFVTSFSKLHIEDASNVDDYINILASFFEKDVQMAKLFSIELANEGNNLSETTLRILSKTIKKLISLLDESVNPIFIQTVVMSVLTTYLNTLQLRNKVSNIVCINEELSSIKESLCEMVGCYLKGKK